MEKNNKIRDIHEYKKQKKNKNKRRRRLNKKIVFFLGAVSVLGICISNVCGYTKVSQLKYDIYYLKQDLNKKEILLNQLEVESNDSSSIGKVETRVREELNMDYPKDEQIEYIRVEE